MAIMSILAFAAAFLHCLSFVNGQSASTASAALQQVAIYQKALAAACPDEYACITERLDAQYPAWAPVSNRVPLQDMIRRRCTNSSVADDPGVQSLLTCVDHMRFNGCDRKLHNNQVPYVNKIKNYGLFYGDGTAKPNCEYNVTISEATDEAFDWTIVIHQHTCLCTNSLYVSGSSFQILSGDANQHLLCSFASFNSDSYTYHCSLVIDRELFSYQLQNPTKSNLSPLTQFHLQQVPNRQCANISVVLLFEAFDAFSESAFTALGVVLHNGEYCLADESGLPPVLQKLHPWLSRSHEPAFMRPCLDYYQRLYLMGSSHSRYLWDAITYDHTPGGVELLEHLEKKHGTAESSDAEYEAVRFLADFPAALMRHCGQIDSIIHGHLANNTLADMLRDPPVRHILAQAGAWDLDYSPIAYLLSSRIGHKKVLKTIQTISQRHCSRFLTITWMSTVAVPLAAENTLHPFMQSRFDEHLLNQSSDANFIAERRKWFKSDLLEVPGCRGYRTDPAIDVLMEFLKNMFSDLTYPSQKIEAYWDSKLDHTNAGHRKMSQFSFVNSFSLMRAFSEEYTSHMHFCNAVQQALHCVPLLLGN